MPLVLLVLYSCGFYAATAVAINLTYHRALSHRAVRLNKALERLGVLLALPATDRAVLLLAEAEGWTGPEIAAELGASPNAVRTRLSRARRAVRERLDGLHPF